MIIRRSKEQVRIAFVVPRYWGHDSIAPPMTLGILAAVIKQAYPRCIVRIFDGSVCPSILQSVVEFAPDIVGVTSVTEQIPITYQFLLDVKRLLPNVATVIGGPHASAMPKEASQYADCVVVGDGEYALLEIVEQVMRGNDIKPVVYGCSVPDLDSLPMPVYELMNLHGYIHQRMTMPRLNRQPVIRMVDQRGCPFKCPFCYNSKRTSPVRFRSAEKLIDELCFLVKNYGIRNVWFHGDDFFVNGKRLSEFSFLMGKTGLARKLRWSCQARATNITSKKVREAKSAGCVSIFIGVEAIAERSLAYLKDNSVSVADVESALTVCRSNKVDVAGSFIAGTPGESIMELKETTDWITNHANKGLSTATMGILTPLPGSKLWDYAVKEGIIDPDHVDYGKVRMDIPLRDRYIVNKSISVAEFSRFYYGYVLKAIMKVQRNYRLRTLQYGLTDGPLMVDRAKRLLRKVKGLFPVEPFFKT